MTPVTLTLVGLFGFLGLNLLYFLLDLGLTVWRLRAIDRPGDDPIADDQPAELPPPEDDLPPGLRFVQAVAVLSILCAATTAVGIVWMLMRKLAARRARS